MRNVQEFLTWGMHRASPLRIPAGSTLCIPLADVGKEGIWQYLYGTTGVVCTQARLARAYDKYYKGWGWSRKDFDSVTAGWPEMAVMLCDCQGLEDWFSGADTNAKGNYANYCTDKGLIADISRPWVLGEAVFVGSKPSAINHVGWVCGFAPDGEPLILHERGLAHGCVIERMSSCGKKWTYRGLMTKRYIYEASDAPSTPAPVTPPETAPTSGQTVLRITSPLMRGGPIKDLQDALNAMGYDCGEADGICGEKTRAGILAFIERHKDM
ncbi:MAG: hypothetical protein EOM66_04820 [Clostridia bacterium]|nr:hypothetical protein [Clostridia bacterium]